MRFGRFLGAAFAFGGMTRWRIWNSIGAMGWRGMYESLFFWGGFMFVVGGVWEE